MQTFGSWRRTIFDGPALSHDWSGAWNLGDVASKWVEAIAALQRGIELGLQVLDTAEMCSDAGSELLVGESPPEFVASRTL